MCKVIAVPGLPWVMEMGRQLRHLEWNASLLMSLLHLKESLGKVRLPLPCTLWSEVEARPMPFCQMP